MGKYRKHIEWARGFESGKRWLDGVAADHSRSIQTEEQYARCLKIFCDWIQKTPDELIAEREGQLRNEDKKIQRKAEENLKTFCLDVERTKGITTDIYHSAVRSFYRYNYCPLMVRTPKTSFDTIRPVTMEDLRTVDMAADERKRFFIRFLKDSGMSREDAVEITYGDIRAQYERGERFIHINAKRRKESINYETFIGSNAIDALEVYLRIRRNVGETITDNTPLIATKYGKKMSPTTLTITLMRLGKKVGIDLSPHRLRKTFETYFSLAKIHPITLKYWMGHKLGSDIEAKYIIPPAPEQKRLYIEGYQKIDIEAPKLSEEQRRKQSLIDNVKMLVASGAYSPEKGERILSMIPRLAKNVKYLSTDAIIKKIAELAEGESERKSDDKDCPNGTHCERFKEISELELLAHLNQGWKIEHNLQNGNVIVRRGR